MDGAIVGAGSLWPFRTIAKASCIKHKVNGCPLRVIAIAQRHPNPNRGPMSLMEQALGTQ